MAERQSGAEAEAERGLVRLKVWRPDFDEFVMLTPAQALGLANQLVRATDQAARAIGEKR